MCDHARVVSLNFPFPGSHEVFLSNQNLSPKIKNSFLHQILPFSASTVMVERSVKSCGCACFYETHLVKVQSDNDVRFLCLFVNSFEEIHMTNVYMGKIVKANTQNIQPEFP